MATKRNLAQEAAAEEAAVAANVARTEGAMHALIVPMEQRTHPTPPERAACRRCDRLDDLRGGICGSCADDLRGERDAEANEPKRKPLFGAYSPTRINQRREDRHG